MAVNFAEPSDFICRALLRKRDGKISRRFMEAIAEGAAGGRKRQLPNIGAAPAWMPDGCPLLPHAIQRAHCRSLSLDVSGPHWITGAAQ